MNPDSQCPPPPPITTIIPIDYSNNNDPSNPSSVSSTSNPQRKPKNGNGGRRKKQSSKQPPNEPQLMDHDYRDFFSRQPRNQGEYLTRGAALASHGDAGGDLGISLAQQAAAVAASRQQQQHLDGNPPVYSVSAAGNGQRGILVEQQLPMQGHDETRRFVNHELVRTRSGGQPNAQKEPSRARNPTILRKSKLFYAM